MLEYGARFTELHEIQDRFHKLSITDELTGLYNRRFIMTEISSKLEEEYKNSLSVIMFDIDEM